MSSRVEVSRIYSCSAEVCAKEVLDNIFEVGGLLPKAPHSPA